MTTTPNESTLASRTYQWDIADPAR